MVSPVSSDIRAAAVGSPGVLVGWSSALAAGLVADAGYSPIFAYATIILAACSHICPWDRNLSTDRRRICALIVVCRPVSSQLMFPRPLAETTGRRPGRLRTALRDPAAGALGSGRGQRPTPSIPNSFRCFRAGLREHEHRKPGLAHAGRCRLACVGQAETGNRATASTVSVGLRSAGRITRAGGSSTCVAQGGRAASFPGYTRNSHLICTTWLLIHNTMMVVPRSVHGPGPDLLTA